MKHAITRPTLTSMIVVIALTAQHCGPRAAATPDPVEPVQPEPAEPEDDRGEPRLVEEAEEPVKVPVTATIEECKIVVSEKIVYKGDPKTAIDPTSFEALDKVAEIILAQPELGVIRIEVHTDERGLGAYNKNLSQERALNVKAYLEDKGVPAASLVALGCGEDQPISNLHNEEGWALNRRTEFHIVECEKE
jgi:outer membrane protein OmpA-like peptidoglycan-associated protein